MRIAIIGSGISGMYAANLLSEQHDVVLYEAADRIGGHTNTFDVPLNSGTQPVDTGFIVYNERNYTEFSPLLDRLGVATQDTEMTFSFRCTQSGLEYCGSSFGGLFAQKRNFFNPRFLGMLREIVRFNKLAPALMDSELDQSLADFLEANNFRGALIDDYLAPMASAIWSARPETVLEFPARHFAHFFYNHGLLQLKDRPQWRTVVGGSRSYIEPLTRPYRDNIRLGTPVREVTRHPDHVMIGTDAGEPERFDAVVIACHSDQALNMLGDPSDAETEVLGAIPYQPNETVLHTDTSLLPERRKAWAAWNYHRSPGHGALATVTYNLSTLQHIPGDTQYLVTLNATDRIDPDKIITTIQYAHPVYNQASMAAQERHTEISGQRRTWYAGAYWTYGFHEDGTRSALKAATAIQDWAESEELHLQRAG